MGRMRPDAVITRLTFSLCTLIAVAVSTWLVLKLRSIQSNEEQPDKPASSCKALSSQYERMDDEFLNGGLNLGSIRAIQPWFHGVHGNDTPWPKRYEAFPEPLPPRAVRILVVPLESSASLAAAGAAITKDALKALPASAKVFSNSRTHYHCTVFHTSHPSDTRPDPFSADGGLGDLASAPPGQRPAPSQAVIDNEVDTLRREVEATESPTLVVDRVLMASSGTLLITWVDPSGRLSELRQRLRGAFPGACTRQATIIHTSLLRLVSDEQLPPESIEALRKVCETWTLKLKGRRMAPETMWWIYESEFSSIFGDKISLRLGAASR